MPKRRDCEGKFTPQLDFKGTMTNTDSLINIDSTRIWFAKGIILLILCLVFSPWIFLLVRNNSIGNVQQKITDFYDENFSCKSMQVELKSLKEGLGNKTVNAL